ncbi:MAG: hypothetical protein AAFN13_13810 [Bacteroidota bacterium]
MLERGDTALREHYAAFLASGEPMHLLEIAEILFGDWDCDAYVCELEEIVVSSVQVMLKTFIKTEDFEYLAGVDRVAESIYGCHFESLVSVLDQLSTLARDWGDLIVGQDVILKLIYRMWEASSDSIILIRERLYSVANDYVREEIDRLSTLSN